MTAVEYFYLSDSPPNVTLGGISQAPNSTDPENPIFNFTQEFVNDLNNVSSLVLGASQPYVSLRAKNLTGEVIDEFNMLFFHNSIDIEGIGKGNRYSERPLMSFKDMTVSTDLASGYLYYTNVQIELKIHKPDLLTSTTLVSLMFPGMPFELEYGWNGPDDKFLNRREKLLFSLQKYDISYDNVGQIDLTIHGMAFNDRFSNLYIGDYGTETPIDKVTGQGIEIENQVTGVAKTKQQIEKYIKFLEGIKKQTEEGSNEYGLVKLLAERYESAEKKINRTITKNFRDAISSVAANSLFFGETFNNKSKDVKCVRFHDLLYSVCHETLKNMQVMFPKVKSLRIVYGSFNKHAGDRSGQSIADFPIQWSVFQEWKKDAISNGQQVPTMQKFLNFLIDLTENEEYWKGFVEEGTLFNRPQVVAHFSNRETNKESVLELFIIDVRAGIPVTTAALPEGKSSDQNVIKAILSEDENFPIIRIGHGNSFIKNITLSHMTDSYMQAAFISRAHENRIANVRETIVQGAALASPSVAPLRLPLQGTASVLGHPQWKPFRSFFLSTGNFLTTAVYTVTKVTHRIGQSGFNTEIEFVYH